MPKDDIKSLLDDAQAHLKKAVRPREKTITDGMLEPADSITPRPPRPRPKAPPPEPLPAAELTSDPENSPPDSGAFDPKEAPTVQLPGRARRRLPSPAVVTSVPGDSVYPHYGAPAPLPGLTPSVMARAERMPLARLLVLIATTATAAAGVVAAGGAAAVNIITALRPPSNIEIAKRLDAMEVRVNGSFGLPLETKTRQEEDEKLDKKYERLEKKVDRLSGAAVPIKVKPGAVRATE